jgi:hypothetical protein
LVKSRAKVKGGVEEGMRAKGEGRRTDEEADSRQHTAHRWEGDGRRTDGRMKAKG